MGDFKINPYGAGTTAGVTGDVAVQNPVSAPTHSTDDPGDDPSAWQCTPTANLPKAPAFDLLEANAVKAKLANMDGTDRQSPAVNVCVNYQNSPEFKALPQAVQNKLLQEAGKDPAVEMRLNQIFQRPLYQNLTTQQRTELLNVFANANDQGRGELVTLMGRQLPSGESALLSRDLSSGATLLDNLNNLANQPLAPGLAGRRSEIVSQAIDDTAEPTWFVDQGQVGTCAPTTLQTDLIIQSPSEYVRLLGGLMGPNRQAKLANGDTLLPAFNDLATPPTVAPSGGASIPDTRSITERVFQSSLAQYAYLQTGKMPPLVDANRDIPGLTRNQIAVAQSGLYGKKYESADASGVISAALLAKKVEAELNKGNGPVPVSLNWGSGGHEVLVDHIGKDANGNTQVYIRNPWGSRDAQGQGYQDGKQLGTASNNTNAGPRRTVVDSQSGLEAMSPVDFVGAVYGAVVEK